MTEKRADYRKKQAKGKNNLLNKVKAAFDDSSTVDTSDVDVNPDFTRDQSERRPLEGNGLEDYQKAAVNSPSPSISDEKRLRLKKRLNISIFVVTILIILVLLALFYL